MKVRTVAVAVALVATAGVMGVRAATDEPRRPPLRLPAASAFAAGPCRDVAAAVLALGRFTYEHEGASSLPADAYPFLRQRADELAAARGTPPGSGAPGGMPPGGTPGPSGAGTAATDPGRQALSARVDAVLTAIGFLRLRPGKAYDPSLLRDLETARADLQQTCVSQA